MLMLYKGGESIGEGNIDGGVDVYNGKTEPALVLVSDSYSEDEIISVCDSRPFSSPAYIITDYLHLLTIALRKIYVILT